MCALRICLCLSFLSALSHAETMKPLLSQNGAEQLGPTALAVKISRVLYFVIESVLDSSHSKDVFYFPCNHK